MVLILIALGIPARTQAADRSLSEGAADSSVAVIEEVPADPPALPLPTEEIESPERLEDGVPFETAWLARVTMRGRATLLRRVAIAGRSAGIELGATVDHPSPGHTTGTFVARSRGPGGMLLAGRIAPRASGSVFTELAGLAHRTSRVPVARVELPTLEAPAGVSSAAVDGVGIRVSPRPTFLHPAFWGLAGRDAADRIPMAAFGILIGDGRRARGGMSLGARGRARTASGSLRFAGRAFRLGAEAAIVADRRAVLVTVETARSPLRLGARWRYRSSDVRPVSCELTAAAGTHSARTLVRVSGVPSGPYGTIERAEIESRLVASDGHTLSLRCGQSATSGFSADVGATERRERYLVVDAVIARTEGRAFSIYASRRVRDNAEGSRVGASLGGRLEWNAPGGRAALLLVIEADRASAGGAEAWSTDLYSGGAVALAARTRSGVHSAARGSLHVGRWRIGGLAESREDGSGRTTAAGTLTLERLWSRETP